MSDYGEEKSQTPARIVYEAMIRAHRARSEWDQSHILGRGRSEPQRARLQSAVVDYLEEMKRYRGKVEEEWAEGGPFEGGLSAVPRIARSTETRTEVTYYGGVRDENTIEEPVQIPAPHLLAVLDDLDDIAVELGFAASTRDRTPEDEITMEQIEGVFGRPQKPESEVATDGGDDV